MMTKMCSIDFKISDHIDAEIRLVKELINMVTFDGSSNMQKAGVIMQQHFPRVMVPMVHIILYLYFFPSLCRSILQSCDLHLCFVFSF